VPLQQNTYVGISVEDTAFGLRVNSVGSVAQAAGLQVGDYVLAVDLDMVSTRAQFLETMQARSPFSRITLRVHRAGGINIITLVPDTKDFVTVTGTPG
jgi:S1-C subfamily serine protease